MTTIVVALGGNAILKHGERGTFEEQYRNICETARKLVDIVRDGYTLVITHGNGPQVGAAMLRYEVAKDIVPPFPLHIADSETQGFIGYMIQQALQNELLNRGIDIPIATIITQVVVDKNDPAFKNPTKPIGPFYTEEEVLKIKREHPEWVFTGDPINGYRRVVPSPDPKEIVEIDIIRKLVENNYIVIACGGGGIPVVKENNRFIGIDAVIDKDLAGEKLASGLNADIYMILTNVEGIYLNYQKKNQKLLRRVKLDKIKQYYDNSHFPQGTMGPKVLSIIRFLENGGKLGIIGELKYAVQNLEGKRGTHIYR